MFRLVTRLGTENAGYSTFSLTSVYLNVGAQNKNLVIFFLYEVEQIWALIMLP